jgi:CheY-like chemotaxis protein
MADASYTRGATMHTNDGRPLILIAERDRTVRELQLFFLNGAGFAVEFADDGQSALERVRQDTPALLITEILIPKIDGLALCRLVRSDAGAAAFLRTPLVESTFLAAINGVMMHTNTAVGAR